MQNFKPDLSPFLVVNNAAEAIEFYVSAFNGQLLEKYDRPDGRVSAGISIDGARFWVGDEEPEYGNLSPTSIGGSPVRMILTVSNPDEIFDRAINAGATQICPVTVEESWKIGKLNDPFGHVWEIGHELDG